VCNGHCGRCLVTGWGWAAHAHGLLGKSPIWKTRVTHAHAHVCTSKPSLYGLLCFLGDCTCTRRPAEGAYWPRYSGVNRSNVTRRPYAFPKYRVDHGVAFTRGRWPTAASTVLRKIRCSHTKKRRYKRGRLSSENVGQTKVSDHNTTTVDAIC
jgi:hypothetical protein